MMRVILYSINLCASTPAAVSIFEHLGNCAGPVHAGLHVVELAHFVRVFSRHILGESPSHNTRTQLWWRETSEPDTFAAAEAVMWAAAPLCGAASHPSATERASHKTRRRVRSCLSLVVRHLSEGEFRRVLRMERCKFSSLLSILLPDLPRDVSMAL